MKFFEHCLLACLCISWLAIVHGCPPICTCKWKDGKQTVECSSKGLSSLPEGIEIGTQVLAFSGNNLKSLPRRAFLQKSLINLQKIYMNECKLAEIDKEAFLQLSNLVVLDLANNVLTEIPSEAFEHTPALRELKLSGNPIDSVTADSFSHTPSIVSLDLSNAKIKSVSPVAFQPLVLLQNLQIQNNQIKELSETLVESLQNSHGLRVHGNPWLCDCRALPLWRLLEKRSIPHPESPMCNSPRRIAGTKFSDLKEESFACPPEIHPVIRVVKGVAGENATVTCPVEGQPPPDVEWYIGDKPVINGSVLGVGPQRVYIVNGKGRHKISQLVITGAQEADSGQIRCIARNPAGRATANFTLAVTMRAFTQDMFGSGHIAGIAIGLIVLALILFIVAFLLFTRTRGRSNSPVVKESTPTISAPCSPLEPNPIQKPPRLTNVSASSSNDPDLISEAEKSSRTAGLNGHIPNGNDTHILHDGEYTRMEGDSLYPSALWDTKGVLIHEHYNPGFSSHQSPAHSTPNNLEGPFDPKIYGYPSDFGLPIPEVLDESIYEQSMMPALTIANELANSYSSRDSPQRLFDKSFMNDDSSIYGTPLVRIQENMVADQVPMSDLGKRINVAEGAESPHPNEKSWVAGGSQGPVSMGVPVLPPLPNSAVHRIKSRDSPDEGYQEGTDV